MTPNRTVSIIAIGLVFLLIPAGLSTGQQGGIGVANDGPTFVDISIIEHGDLILINATVRDLNGWNDIFSVNVTIFDNEGVPISKVCYMQYSNPNTGVCSIQWNETLGNSFVVDDSAWTPTPISPWNTNIWVTDVGLNVSFAFERLPGHTVNILATDRGLLTCEYNGPFPIEYIPDIADDDEEEETSHNDDENYLLIISLILIVVAVIGIAAVAVLKRPKPPRPGSPPYHSPQQYAPGQPPNAPPPHK